MSFCRNVMFCAKNSNRKMLNETIVSITFSIRSKKHYVLFMKQTVNCCKTVMYSLYLPFYTT